MNTHNCWLLHILHILEFFYISILYYRKGWEHIATLTVQWGHQHIGEWSCIIYIQLDQFMQVILRETILQATKQSCSSTLYSKAQESVSISTFVKATSDFGVAEFPQTFLISGPRQCSHHQPRGKRWKEPATEITVLHGKRVLRNSRPTPGILLAKPILLEPDQLTNTAYTRVKTGKVLWEVRLIIRSCRRPT